jgi:hypothetical protein
MGVHATKQLRDATVEELLGDVFSVLYVPCLYNEVSLEFGRWKPRYFSSGAAVT